MKKIVAFISGLLTLATTVTTDAQQRSTDDKSLLWKISGKNLAKPSFLFGTIHLICRDDYFWTDKMKESFDKSEKVCFEMDLDDPEVMMQTVKGLVDKSGKKLYDYFTPDQYMILGHYVKETMGMDISVFEQMKPMALLTLLGTSDITCEDAVSYEDSLMKTAEQDKKEILGLELAEEQLSVLESIPTDTIVQQLMDQVQQKNPIDSEFAALVRAYKNQDLPELYKLLTSNKDLSNNMDIFIDERNRKWIPRMNDKMKKSSIFFAVGAGHLYGDAGVISLLRKDGYTVTAIK